MLGLQQGRYGSPASHASNHLLLDLRLTVRKQSSVVDTGYLESQSDLIRRIHSQEQVRPNRLV